MPRFTKEQQLAIDSEGQNILVSAGAGSGKTAVLSERVLRKIKEGVSVEDLLVLTFTKAAAAEMKERIRKKIKSIPELKSEYEKIESAYITTFDSFALSVLRKYHYLKDLDKNVNICDASILKLKKKEILDNLFEEYYQNKTEDFLILLNTFTLKNDNDIKDFIYSSYNEIDLIYDKNNYLNNYINNYFSDEIVNKVIDKYVLLIKDNVDSLLDSYNDIIRIDSMYADKILVNNLFESSTYLDYKNNIDIDVPRLPKNSSEELKKEKEKFKKILDNIKKLLIYENVETLKEDYLCNKNNINTIINIIKEYDKRVCSFKINENLFDFLDIAKFSIDILKENEEARLFYKNKFNEILIDEYQDTSDIQETFMNLIADNNLYMVGDIKQSIYRFRNANPNIFKDKFENYGKNINGLRIDLNKNFRSREEVLNNINIMFNPLMDSYLGGANYKFEHQLSFGNMMYNEEGFTGQNNNYEVLNYVSDDDKKYTDEEIEIFTIATDIKKKVENKYIIFDKDESIKRPALYSDFAILIDRSATFNQYRKIFEYLGIPISVHNKESIKSSDIVKIVKNIFILINKINKKEFDLNFNYSYLSVGRSYLFNMEDNDLYNIITNRRYFNTEIYNICYEISNNLNIKNVNDILNEIIVKFNIYERNILIGDIIKNEVIVEYLQNISSSSSSIYNIDEFIKYLDNITTGDLDIEYSLSADTSGVVLMKVHGSKGLEFPVVYFSGLSKKFNIMELNEKYIFNKDIGFILPIKKDYLKSSFLKTIYRDKYFKDEISEKLRLFYVALTRAKEKMIFVMKLKNEKDYAEVEGVINNYDRLKYRSFGDFLESINKYLINNVVKVDLSNINLSKDYLYSKKNNGISNIKTNNELLEVLDYQYNNEIITKNKFSKSSKVLFTESERKNIKIGLDVHLIMEHLNFNNPDYDNIDSKYINFIKRFLSLDILKGYKNIYKEYEFIYNKENEEYHGIIDLLIEFDDKYIVVDYKLKNVMNDNYIKQLNGYKDYIENITNKVCDIYLYSFIDGNLQEI